MGSDETRTSHDSASKVTQSRYTSRTTSTTARTRDPPPLPHLCGNVPQHARAYFATTQPESQGHHQHVPGPLQHVHVRTTTLQQRPRQAPGPEDAGPLDLGPKQAESRQHHGRPEQNHPGPSARPARTSGVRAPPAAAFPLRVRPELPAAGPERVARPHRCTAICLQDSPTAQKAARCDTPSTRSRSSVSITNSIDSSTRSLRRSSGTQLLSFKVIEGSRIVRESPPARPDRRRPTHRWVLHPVCREVAVVARRYDLAHASITCILSVLGQTDFRSVGRVDACTGNPSVFVYEEASARRRWWTRRCGKALPAIWWTPRTNRSVHRGSAAGSTHLDPDEATPPERCHPMSRSHEPLKPKRSAGE